MAHKLFLTTRQATKIRNAFADSISTDIKPSKTEIFEIIQSVGSFGSLLANLDKKALTNVANPLARDNLSGFVSCLVSKKPKENLVKKELSGQEKNYFIYFE